MTSNAPSALKNIAQLMLFKGIGFSRTHKKKIIFALVFLVLAYIAKKKLTLAHVISLVGTFSKIVELIPLPQAPKLRLLAEYSHSQSLPPKAVYECMNVKTFQKRIESRQNCFEELKYEHLTGAVLTLVLYNANAYYFLIQNKYSSDFLELNASTEFEQIMYGVRKRFTEEIANLFQKTKQLLRDELNRVELKQVCSIEEIAEILQRMVDKLLDARFDLSKEESYTYVNKVSKKAKNRFVSEYEYTPQTNKSVLSKVGGAIFKVIGGVVSYGDWFPSPNIKITNERLEFIKCAYILPLKKAKGEAEAMDSSWPNDQARELFQLVVQQMQFGLSSLNFSVLLRSYAHYNLKILRNRVKKLMIVKSKTQISIVVLLAALHKILNEQFFKPNQFELRDTYHNAQVKKSLKLVSLQNPSSLQNQPQNLPQQHQKEPISQEEHILEQVYLKNSFQYLQKEFQLKLFNQRSGLVMRPKKGEANEADEMQKLLTLMGGSAALNQQE